MWTNFQRSTWGQASCRRRTRHTFLLRALAVVVVLAVITAAADDPFTGTWKLNRGKSKLLPGDTTISDVYRTVADNNTIRIKEQMTDDRGVHNITVEARFDGKDYPVTGDPMSDSVSYERVKPDRIKITTKKGSQITAEASTAVSRDGRTITVHFVVYAGEKSQSGTAVYEKQPD
jgi:hypothetical protein